MAGLYQGQTISIYTVNQGAAGSSDIVAAPTGANERVFLISINVGMAAAGTLKFTEGTTPTDITGALPVPINGGFVMRGDVDSPVLWTRASGAKMSLVTTGAAAQGWILYFIGNQSP